MISRVNGPKKQVSFILLTIVILVISSIALLLRQNKSASIGQTDKPGDQQTSISDSKPSQGSSGPANSSHRTAQEKSYLSIREWNIKIPTPDVTKNASYEFKNGYANLKVNFDPNAPQQCTTQAYIQRIENYDPNSDKIQPNQESLNKYSTFIDSAYYVVVGSQSACTADKAQQDIADTIRTEWLQQGKNIVKDS